jgi:hypothetical protein
MGQLEILRNNPITEEVHDSKIKLCFKVKLVLCLFETVLECKSSLLACQLETQILRKEVLLCFFCIINGENSRLYSASTI